MKQTDETKKTAPEAEALSDEALESVSGGVNDGAIDDLPDPFGRSADLLDKTNKGRRGA